MPIARSILFVCISIICYSASAQSSSKRKNPEPANWYAGDMHVHRNCGTDSIISEKKLLEMMEVNDLAVISLLADMGNAEVKDSKTDLLKVTGKAAPQSVPGRIINWDVEWHWDATYAQFQKQALGGHLVLLGLKEAHQLWEESPYKILDWGKKQHAVSGFAHMEYLNDSIQDYLNCCIPVDYPVEAAMGTIHFISEDVLGASSANNGNYFSEGAINAYYKLLNCGFRISLVAGTDFPCNNYEPLGTLLTYVQVPGKTLTYTRWVEGIAKGRTVVSRNAHNEFLDLKVNGTEGPGNIIHIKDKKTFKVTVNWTANQEISGRVELVSNGKVIATQEGTAKPGHPIILTSSHPFSESGWVCARRMNASGHVLHTSPVYVSVNDLPVRANAADAEFFIAWIDNILKNIEPGGKWNKYFPNDYETIKKRYLGARNIYQKIKSESEGIALQSGISVSRQTEDSAKARFQQNTRAVVLDSQSKIIPWSIPRSRAYDQFLQKRWNFIKTMVPASPGPAPRSNYPQYYFYCACREKDGVLEPDNWMNDVGEKIPNWFESARLFYAYTGDSSVMTIVKKFVDYTLEHGTSPPDFSWPNFPYTTTNAGDTEFRGFTSAKRFSLHEIQVDHAGDMGLTYYRLYQYTGENKYLAAALNVANVLAAKVETGSAARSPWPYLVIMNTGEVTSPYGANWMGCYLLLDNLAKAGIGNVNAYREACRKVKDFILKFPMKTGYWTDGHTDNAVKSNTYRSNMSASNMKLYMLDYPEFNPDWKTDMPKLIKWTEDYFINRGDSSEPGNMWGANIVGEQDEFMFKMDYQTARYAAECARWYAVTGKATYKEKAYRSLNWVTYCSDSNGMAFESPLSKGISNWWSDCYGEGPRMFYHAFAAVPEWAPPHENHILYSRNVLKEVSYQPGKIEYTATGTDGTDYLRLAFKPAKLIVNGIKLSSPASAGKQGFVIKNIGSGDYSVTVKRNGPGKVIITK